MTKKHGRPTKLTKELQTRICEYIYSGSSKQDAALLCGITRKTLENWLERGKTEELGMYVDFAEAVETALAAFKQTQIDLIATAAEKHWQAAAWLLERRFPREWGRREALEVEAHSEHKQTNEIIFPTELLQDPEAKELLKQLYRRQNALTK